MLGETTTLSDLTPKAQDGRSSHMSFPGDRVEDGDRNDREIGRSLAGHLVGIDAREAPEVIERLWGRCPVSYQLPACEALELAMGVEVTPGIRGLRRLIYCGEWIRSHALQIHLLAPDFAPEPRVPDPEALERCLRIRRLGETLVSALSASPEHPINIAVGGFHRAPRARDLAELRPALEWGVGASVEMLRLVTELELPAGDASYADYEMVCLHHARRYPMNEGHVVSSRGLVVPVSQYEARFGDGEPGTRGDRTTRETTHLVGPLARVNMSLHQLSPTALKEAGSCGVAWPSGNVFHSLMARAIESIHACEEAIAIVDQYERDLTQPRVEPRPKSGRACHAAEVPGGLAYHCYRVDHRGRIVDARIVTPGSQNPRRAGHEVQA